MPIENDVTNARRGRAAAQLTALALAVLVAVVVVAEVLYARTITSPNPTASERLPHDPGHGSSSHSNAPKGERQLAQRPMMRLPAEAALPQPLALTERPKPIILPEPGQTSGRRVPGGFAPTSAGALSQLKALDEVAMRGRTPAAYARLYRAHAEPGAPQPSSTGLYELLDSYYDEAGIDPATQAGQLKVSYEITHGQVKGTATGGEYVVACVLGQLTLDYRGHTVSAGVGDCQALRYTGRGWVIASGPLPAAAPSAWPGSADSIAAGYRELKP